MKIVQFGDIHISDTRIEEFEYMIPAFTKKIIEQNPDLIIFTGDLFIHRDKLSPKQVELARKLFKEYLPSDKLLIIPGNHDTTMSSKKIDSLSAIFTSDLKIYTHIGDYVDIMDYRFHMFPYPSRSEYERLGIQDMSDFFNTDKLNSLFQKKGTNDILIFHGTLEGFSMTDSYKASENAINVGKDLVLPTSFWKSFTAIMAGHLHKYQKIDNAVYSGAPFPLTFADNFTTGFIVWEDLIPSFIDIEQKYKYITVDIGTITGYVTGLTNELERRIDNNKDYTNNRVRVKYTAYSSQSGDIDHSVISSYFKDAIEIKIIPSYVGVERKKDNISLEDFSSHNLTNIIDNYIDENKYHPEVKEIAKKIEDIVSEKITEQEDRGIHFKLNTLSVSNFKCFGEKNKIIDFTKLENVVGIFGRNKTGKSSLVDAITWCMFGTTLRNKDIKSVIRNGQKAVVVEITFVSHNTEYKIVRTRAKHALLELYQKIGAEWVNISEGNSTLTQRKIETIVGTFDMFISISYSPQNGIDLLVKKRPSERKQIILDCLQVEVLQKRQEEIMKIKKSIRDKIMQTKGGLKIYSEELSSLVAGNHNEMVAKFEALLSEEKTNQTRINTRLSSMTRKVYEYEDLEDEHAELNSSIKINSAKIDKIYKNRATKIAQKEKMEVVITDKSIIKDKIEQIEKAEDECSRYAIENTVNLNRKRNIKELEKERDEKEKSIDNKIKVWKLTRETALTNLKNMELLNCPRADCPLNNRIKEQEQELRTQIDAIENDIEMEKTIIVQMKMDYGNKIQQIYDELNRSFYDGQEHIKYVNGCNKEYKEKWVGLKNRIDSGEDIIQGMIEIIDAYNSQIDGIREINKKLIEKRTEVAKKIGSISVYKEELEKNRIEMVKCNERIEQYTSMVFNHKRDLNLINELNKKILKEQSSLKKLEEYQNHCSKYAEIVSKNGVMFSIVDNALPTIETFAQELLAKTTNGMISISLDAYRTLASGDKAEEIAIYITDAKGKRDVLEASGSELVLVSLALRAAMAHLLSLRMGSKVDLFIIDEGFGAFDEENVTVVKEMLRYLGKKFNKILFITHVVELMDVAESIIRVTSNGLISNYSVKENINGE